MNKFTVDQIEDVLDIIEYECPGTNYSELFRYECDCNKVNSCYECWVSAIHNYNNDKMLKSMNDNENEDK